MVLLTKYDLPSALFGRESNGSVSVGGVRVIRVISW